jgi:hypothetical protein
LAGLKKSAAKNIPYIASFQLNTHTTTLVFRQQLSLFVPSAQSLERTGFAPDHSWSNVKIAVVFNSNHETHRFSRLRPFVTFLA